MAIDGSKLMSFKILCFNVDFTKIVIYTRVTRKTHAKQIAKNTYKNNQENRYTFVFAILKCCKNIETSKCRENITQKKINTM